MARQRRRGVRRPPGRTADRRADRARLAHGARSRRASGCPRCSPPPTPGCGSCAGGMPDAGGMVIASDQTTARAYAKLLARSPAKRRPWCCPTIPAPRTGSSSSPPAPARGWSRCAWCPKASTCPGWPSASTPPARRLRCTSPRRSGGSCVRRQPGETASVFLPSVPSLLHLASELEAQRNHVLGKPHREIARRRNARANASKTEASRASGQRVRIAGRRRRTRPGDLRRLFVRHRTPAGSDEEADYLGIPGLLDADQMRDLLRRRQEEQLAMRTASG